MYNHSHLSGDNGKEVTPVPMPNTEVKPLAPMVVGLRSARVGRCQAIYNGELAQLGEHLPYKQRVGGSNPSFSTIL